MKTALLIPLLLYSINNSIAEQFSVAVDHDTDVSITRYKNDSSNIVFIWLPSEDGFQKSEFKMGLELNKIGEVWYPDLFESRFLPEIASSLNKIPASDVTSLIQTVANKNKTAILIGSGRGILPLLTGAHLWQTKIPRKPTLAGLILLSPNFYLETPEPGKKPEFLPVTEKTSLPIFIIQPKLSPWFWKLSQTMQALTSGGSEVYLRVLPDVRDRFYYRPDASTKENAQTILLPGHIIQAANLLLQIPYKVRHPGKIQAPPFNLTSSKKERKLTPFKGNPLAPELGLPKLDGTQLNLNDFQDKVVLVNFWASWCPPCVHEMPSMQRLQQSLHSSPFTILAVNMAEDESTIKSFLTTKVNVSFPVLLDRDGAALTRWQVFAFPTSYLIDKEGKIRYAIFGSVQWDEPDKINVIKSLINE